MLNDSILYHKEIANDRSTYLGDSVKIHRKIAGHLMVIRKSTWNRILPILLKKASGKQILGDDTKISKAILEIGLDVRLMKDVYVLHYCRLAEGLDYTKYLEPCTKQ